VFLYDFLNPAKSTGLQVAMGSQGQNRFEPKFGAALRTGNMDMSAAFLSGSG
jgi:hypothetical protein